LAVERLKPDKDVNLVSGGNECQTFTVSVSAQKKLLLVLFFAAPFKQFKTMAVCPS